jgi:sec-independent protein translocase protein TatB
MFGLGWGEIVVLGIVGLFVFGPERLPAVIADAAKTLRQVRAMATGMTNDLKAELGPEFADLDLASLDPRRLVERHLLGDDEPAAAPPAAARTGWPPARPAATLPDGEIPPYDLEAT